MTMLKDAKQVGFKIVVQNTLLSVTNVVILGSSLVVEKPFNLAIFHVCIRVLVLEGCDITKLCVRLGSIVVFHVWSGRSRGA